MKLVDTQTLTGQCSVFCGSEAEVEIVRARELRALREHHAEETILDHAVSIVADLSQEQRAEREIKIAEFGDRDEFEFRETADSLWERAPARMQADAERCVTRLAELGYPDVKAPAELTVESVRALKSFTIEAERFEDEITATEEALDGKLTESVTR